MIDFETLYSANARNMKKSVIRELLKLTIRPEIISFAGGLPAPETFPVADLQVAANVVFDKHATKALQYGTTEGDNDLKAEIIKFEGRQGVALQNENLLIVSASQQALDMVCKVFLDPDDYVVAGRPTYVGAIQAIQSYSARVLGIPFTAEQDGFDMAALERSWNQAVKDGKKLKCIYVIPDFQNPAGFCWSLAKRQALLDFAYRNNTIIVEDSPYREIRFIGEHLPSIYQLDQQGQNRGVVINLKTFSKILSPGVRMGWIMGHETIINKFVVAKQAMDLCTNVFAQKWLAEFMKTGKLYDVIKSTCDNYRTKRNVMIEALDEHMPKHPQISWTKPEGGLFLWIALPHFINTDNLIYKAVEEEHVAFVVGSAFYFDEPEHNAMRINFSYSSPDLIREGVKRLARIIGKEIAAHQP
jgi:2-aminoadipate transaminase